MLWELVVLVHLIVLEGVEVENDSLKVHDEDIWCLRNQGSLADIYLLLAARALIVADSLALDELG